MKDNFDLKKFLTENKTMESSNPYLKEDMKKQSLREKIREMILTEIADYADYDEMDDEGDDELSYYKSMNVTDNPFGEEDEDDMIDPRMDPAGGMHDEDEDDYAAMYAEQIGEAKKDEEEEVEADEEDATEEEGEEVEAEEGDVDITDEEGGDFEGDMDVPEMEGDEGEILTHLMQALKGAKAAGDDKLIKQIGNTVTFLTRQYISSGGGEE